MPWLPWGNDFAYRTMNIRKCSKKVSSSERKISLNIGNNKLYSFVGKIYPINKPKPFERIVIIQRHYNKAVKNELNSNPFIDKILLISSYIHIRDEQSYWDAFNNDPHCPITNPTISVAKRFFKNEAKPVPRKLEQVWAEFRFRQFKPMCRWKQFFMDWYVIEFAFFTVWQKSFNLWQQWLNQMKLNKKSLLYTYRRGRKCSH